MRRSELVYTSPSCFLTSNKNSWSIQKQKVMEMKILLIRERDTTISVSVGARCWQWYKRRTSFLGNWSNAEVWCGNSWMLSAVGLLVFGPVQWGARWWHIVSRGSSLTASCPWDWTTKSSPSCPDCLALHFAENTWILAGLQQCELILNEVLRELEKANTRCSSALFESLRMVSLS